MDLSKIEIKRSDRRTISVEIHYNGDVIVRAPYYVKNTEISEFLESRCQWIEKHTRVISERNKLNNSETKLNYEEIRRLADAASKIIPERGAYYAPMINVNIGRITIRNQRTRWGSCSSKGNLSFNCLLMLTPPEVIDSVVVHELCHIKEMNHSERFYSQVLRVFPEYRKWDKWLKENGGSILNRLP